MANNSKYPFDKMEIGDEFGVENMRANTMWQAISYYHKTRYPKRFATRWKDGILWVYRKEDVVPGRCPTCGKDGWDGVKRC